MLNNNREQFVYFSKATVGPHLTSSATHPLWRRMTWTGKSIIEAVTGWEAAHDMKLADIVKTERVGVYYGTYFGEMEAGLIVAEGILKPDHVISPTAFQQSVHNAPVAYLMQVLQCDAPTATITSGKGSFDRAIAMASSDILSESIDIAVVLQSSEYHTASSDAHVTAEAELCVIVAGNKLSTPAHWKIESVAWTQSDTTSAKSIDESKLTLIPLDLDGCEKSFFREVPVGHGRVISSSWQRVVPGLNGTDASTLLPHRAPMLLVDHLIEGRDDGSAWIQATLRPGSFLFDHEVIRPQWLVEVLAQATGVAFNATRHFVKKDGKAGVGYLLSVDRFDAEGARICKPGDVLKIHVTLDADLYPLGKYGAVAYLGDAVIARASMKFLSDDSGEVALTGKGFSS